MSADCKIPPGWTCTREPHTEGPCAAVQVVNEPGKAECRHSPEMLRAIADIIAHTGMSADDVARALAAYDDEVRRLVDAARPTPTPYPCTVCGHPTTHNRAMCNTCDPNQTQESDHD